MGAEQMGFSRLALLSPISAVFPYDFNHYFATCENPFCSAPIWAASKKLAFAHGLKQGAYRIELQMYAVKNTGTRIITRATVRGSLCWSHLLQLSTTVGQYHKRLV